MDETRLDRIERMLEGLTQTVELVAGMQKKNEESIEKLTKETRRFVYWAEAAILNHESRLRALAKEPPPSEVL